MKTRAETDKRLNEILKTDLTYEQAAKALNAEGYRTPTGMKWEKQKLATWVFTRDHQGDKRRSRNGKAKATAAPAILKELSAQKKLSMIKQIVMGLHQ